MKCLLYARVSSERQARMELSVPAQMGAMRDYAKKKEWRVVGVYIDEAKSGKSINRPELQKLIQRETHHRIPNQDSFHLHHRMLFHVENCLCIQHGRHV